MRNKNPNLVSFRFFNGTPTYEPLPAFRPLCRRWSAVFDVADAASEAGPPRSGIFDLMAPSADWDCWTTFPLALKRNSGLIKMRLGRLLETSRALQRRLNAITTGMG